MARDSEIALLAGLRKHRVPQPLSRYFKFVALAKASSSHGTSGGHGASYGLDAANAPARPAGSASTNPEASRYAGGAEILRRGGSPFCSKMVPLP
jgi:hypothetical protein